MFWHLPSGDNQVSSTCQMSRKGWVQNHPCWNQCSNSLRRPGGAQFSNKIIFLGLYCFCLLYYIFKCWRNQLIEHTILRLSLFTANHLALTDANNASCYITKELKMSINIRLCFIISLFHLFSRLSGKICSLMY